MTPVAPCVIKNKTQTRKWTYKVVTGVKAQLNLCHCLSIPTLIFGSFSHNLKI